MTPAERVESGEGEEERPTVGRGEGRAAEGLLQQAQVGVARADADVDEVELPGEGTDLGVVRGVGALPLGAQGVAIEEAPCGVGPVRAGGEPGEQRAGAGGGGSGQGTSTDDTRGSARG